MKFTLSSKVLVEGASKEQKKLIKEHLTISNPVYVSKLSMELPVWGVDPKLRFYEEDKEGLKIPIGAFNEVLDLLQAKGAVIKPSDIVDKRVTTSDAEYFKRVKFLWDLRDYQQTAGDSLRAPGITVGVLQAQTGAGKSAIFIHHTINIGVNTLILVHTKELAEQTIKAFLKSTNLNREDIGFIGSGRFEIKPISVGLLQTVTKLKGQQLKQVQEYFGQIVSDEVHIIAAETYFEAMGRLPAKYKFGFSGTIKREDGLTPAIHWATGPLIHSVPPEALESFLIKPSYRQVRTSYYFPLFNTSEYQTMITHMAEDTERNKLIIKEFEKNKDTPSVFLCNRTSQVKLLHELIPRSVMLTSQMTKKAREKAMEKLHSGEADHAVSTFGLFSTGLDIPKLSALYLCSPIKSNIKLRQSAGRLMRKAEGKTSSFIVDFIDPAVGLLMGQARTRKRILTNL